MANFVSRNVLICVVPAVVLLLSVYWFRKKKKMKQDIPSPINKNTLVVNKSNVYISQSSTCLSEECSSDFSNTLSDASSISSPESSLRTPSISDKILSENADGDCMSLTVSNHIDKLNYQDVISVIKENSSQIQTEEKSENSVGHLVQKEQLDSTDFENKESNDDPKELNKNAINSLHVNVNHSFNDSLESCSSENEVIETARGKSDISNCLPDSNFNSQDEIVKQEQKSEVSEVSIINDVASRPTIPVEKIESDSHDSHSSVLDENSLSSVSDESEKQVEDFKYKDSPSSVFDGNSISDESEKTDVSNEHNVIPSKTDENYKSSVDYVNDVFSLSCGDSNENEQYLIKLSKNSFINKTILTADTASKVSNSCIIEDSASNSQNSYSMSTSNLQNFSGDSNLSVKKDDACVDQPNNQSMQQSREVDTSEDNCNSSVATSLTSEVLSLDSENVISSTSSEKNNHCEAQLEVTMDNLCSDFALSSTDEISKDFTKVNGEQIPVISPAESNASSEIVKYQDEKLEQNESKVANLDAVDLKSSGSIPGLFMYEFDLPRELCGRLIGKQGKHVKSIKERTNANVFIKRHPFDTNLKTVVVEGSRSAVYEALEIIRRKFPPSQFPTVTLIQTNMLSSHGVSLPESLQLHLPEGASCDVILSSLVSADHFFLQQPTHPTYPSLGTLDHIMISCYTQMDTPLLPQPVEAGVICAAPVMNGWFRAQIIYVFENRTECEIKFVDYGGFSQVSISSLRQIRSDFMTLPFQASECYLANVRPVDAVAGWSSEANSVFEELAQGQILQALLVEYAEDGIPCVQLYRVQGVSNMFINRELVERGLAVWVDNGRWDPH